MDQQRCVRQGCLDQGAQTWHVPTNTGLHCYVLPGLTLSTMVMPSRFQAACLVSSLCNFSKRAWMHA